MHNDQDNVRVRENIKKENIKSPCGGEVLSGPARRVPKRELKRIWTGLFLRLFFLALVIGGMFTFVFGIHIADSNDMYPAIKEGDLVAIYRLGSYTREDVVEYAAQGKTYFGRIVGTEGTEVGTTEDGRLTLDGRFLPIQPRQGIYEETLAESHSSAGNTSTLAPSGQGQRDSESESLSSGRIPTGSFYILGDRRSDAVDSRQLGAISKKDIRGKVFTIWRRRNI